jgi:hypothetical protein
MRLADRVLLLLPGEAIEGPPAALRERREPRIAGFFDENAEVCAENGDEAPAAPVKKWKPRW